MANFRVNRRRFMGIAGGASAAIATLLSSCGTPAATPAAPAGGETAATSGAGGRLIDAPEGKPETTSIVVAMDNPNYATQAQYYIARDLGFFQQEGFSKVEILTADDTFLGVVSGDITFANTDTDILINGVVNNQPARMICCNRDHEWQIIGLGSDIKAPADLIGKKVILNDPGTREWARSKAAISRWSNGEVDIDRDCEGITVSGGSDNWNQALVSGQVSASIQYPRHVESVKKAGGTILLGGWNEVPQEAMTVNTDFAAKNPITVLNYLRAILKARAVWCDPTRKDEVIALLKATNQFNFREGFERAYFVEPEQYSIHAGFAMQSMNSYLTDLGSYGLVPEGMRYEAFADLSFLHKAQKQILGTTLPSATDQSLLTLY